LDFLTNNVALMGELIELLTISPKESESDDRKYKLPLMGIEMIETETTCIQNAFFK
jgi:hypothetical protein